jgi:hypothetical protein
MSAFGPKQTLARALHMSAFGGKADMRIAATNIRFGGKALNRADIVCSPRCLH